MENFHILILWRVISAKASWTRSGIDHELSRYRVHKPDIILCTIGHSSSPKNPLQLFKMHLIVMWSTCLTSLHWRHLHMGLDCWKCDTRRVSSQQLRELYSNMPHALARILKVVHLIYSTHQICRTVGKLEIVGTIIHDILEILFGIFFRTLGDPCNPSRY